MRVTILFATSLVALGACATKSQTGAVVGADKGVVAGGVIGKVAGSTAKGAIIGAVVGGVAGTIIGAQMDKQANEMEQTIKGATIERVGEGIQVTFASGLLYDFDSDVVRPDAKTEFGSWRRASSNTRTPARHHRPHRPARQQRLQPGLSERRSNAAATYIISQGVSGTRIGTCGLGETEPAATNDTEAGRQANRRVEVAIFASKEAREAAKPKQPYSGWELGAGLGITPIPGSQPHPHLRHTELAGECHIEHEALGAAPSLQDFRDPVQPGRNLRIFAWARFPISSRSSSASIAQNLICSSTMAR